MAFGVQVRAFFARFEVMLVLYTIAHMGSKASWRGGLGTAQPGLSYPDIQLERGVL